MYENSGSPGLQIRIHPHGAELPCKVLTTYHQLGPNVWATWCMIFDCSLQLSQRNSNSNNTMDGALTPVWTINKSSDELTPVGTCYTSGTVSTGYFKQNNKRSDDPCSWKNFVGVEAPLIPCFVYVASRNGWCTKPAGHSQPALESAHLSG